MDKTTMIGKEEENSSSSSCMSIDANSHMYVHNDSNSIIDMNCPRHVAAVAQFAQLFSTNVPPTNVDQTTASSTTDIINVLHELMIPFSPLSLSSTDNLHLHRLQSPPSRSYNHPFHPHLQSNINYHHRHHTYHDHNQQENPKSNANDDEVDNNSPPEPNLLTLVQSYNWADTLHRLRQNPSEAATLVDSENLAPLHIACDHDAPAIVVRALLEADEYTIRRRLLERLNDDIQGDGNEGGDDDSNDLLSTTVIQRAVTRVGRANMNPLHITCTSRHASACVISELLYRYSHITNHHNYFNPTQTSSSPPPPQPTTANTRRRKKRKPPLFSEPTQCHIVQQITTMRDDDGDMPLHVACRCGAPIDVLALLLEANPIVVWERDHEGLTPLLRLWVRYFVMLGEDVISGVKDTDDLVGTGLHDAWEKSVLLLRASYNGRITIVNYDDDDGCDKDWRSGVEEKEDYQDNEGTDKSGYTYHSNCRLCQPLETWSLYPPPRTTITPIIDPSFSSIESPATPATTMDIDIIANKIVDDLYLENLDIALSLTNKPIAPTLHPSIPHAPSPPERHHRQATRRQYHHHRICRLRPHISSQHQHEPNSPITKPFLPIHATALVDCPRPIILIATRLYRHQLEVCDEGGYTPLAIAARMPIYEEHDLSEAGYCIDDRIHDHPMTDHDHPFPCNLPSPSAATMTINPSVIQILLDANSDVASLPNPKTGRIPLHYAILAGKSWFDGGIRAVLEAFPEGIMVKDPVSGLYPFMLAAVRSDGRVVKEEWEMEGRDNRDADRIIMAKSSGGGGGWGEIGMDVETEMINDDDRADNLTTIFCLLRRKPESLNWAFDHTNTLK